MAGGAEKREKPRVLMGMGGIWDFSGRRGDENILEFNSSDGWATLYIH